MMNEKVNSGTFNQNEISNEGNTQVWTYDTKKVFVDTILVREVLLNMTTVPLNIGYIKPTFNEDLHEWYEGATQEEIDAWHEANKPIEEPDKNTILEGRINELQAENIQQSSDITTNSDMIFMTMDATTELNESGIQNTQMVLISMDALTEINEQLILLQEEVNKLKGGVA